MCAQACIDQTNIDNNLACLPVYLSGCRRLLVFAGETYATRLWCIMEMFIFLRMGGSPDRLTVIPLVGDRSGTDTEQALRRNFTTFKASKAQCYDPNDKHRLLAVIESGFGNFVEFDRLVRNMFDERGASYALAGASVRPSLMQGASSTARVHPAVEAE